MSLLEVSDLNIWFDLPGGGQVHAVQGVSFGLDAGQRPRRACSPGRDRPTPCNVELQKTMTPEHAPSMPIPDFERTAIAVAAKLGIVSDAPIVLAEGMSTVVHLRPSPIVGRVTRLTHLVRPVDDVTGTIALARASGLVVHRATGSTPDRMSRMAVRDVLGVRGGCPGDPSEAGSSLRAFHRARR